MAQFSLSLINKHGTTVLTDYDTLVGKTAGLTFDEHLNLNVDGSTLDFSMLKYLYEGAQKVVNTSAVSITYGSIIKCLHNGHRYDFAITDINYQFLAENLQLSFSAQDYFQFETSKLGIGYTISGDTTDPSYFGAQPIDAWAYKIIKDNNLRWGYVPINQANREWINTALTASQKQATFTTDNTGEYYWENALQEADQLGTKAEYTLNQWVSFECSDSTAYNALKQLGADNGLMIVVDYANHNFWFAPKQNIIFNGYYFNPNNNLQQFSVKGSIQNLVTVLNITGPKDINNQEITLVPQLPTQIVQLIESKEWDHSVYYPGLYTEYVSDITFLREAAYAPWLENKLIDISFFQDNHLLLNSEVQQIQDTLYNQLRRINGRLLIEQHNYLTQFGEDYQKFTQKIIDAEGLEANLYSDIATIQGLLDSNNAACFATIDAAGTPWVYWPPSFTLYGTINNETHEITANSLLNEFRDYLYTPEVTAEYTETVYLQPSFHFSTTGSSSDLSISLQTESGNITGSFGAISGDTVVYQGSVLEYNGVSAWQIVTTKNTGPHHQGKLDFNHWNDVILNFSTQGPSAPIRVQRSDDIIRVSWKLGNNWSTPHQVTEERLNLETWGSCRLDDDGNFVYYINALVNYCDIYVCSFPFTIKWKSNTSSDYVSVSELNFDQVSSQLILSTTINDSSYQEQYLHIGSTTTPATSDIALPVASNSSMNIALSYEQSNTSTKSYRHLSIKNGPITIYGQLDLGNDNFLRTNDLIVRKIDNQLNSPLFLHSIYNANQFTDKTPINTPTIVVDQLNQLCGVRDNYAQTLAQRSWELYELWIDKQYSNQLCTGVAVLQLQDVGMLPSTDDSALIITANESPHNNLFGSPIFSTTEVNYLRAALHLHDDEDLYRTAVIQYVANIQASITEKWNICYAAAMGLGVYWPAEWNNSEQLIRNSRLAFEQANLMEIVSPLIPNTWSESFTVSDLTLNVQFMPYNQQRQTVSITNCSEEWSEWRLIYTNLEQTDLHIVFKTTIFITIFDYSYTKTNVYSFNLTAEEPEYDITQQLHVGPLQFSVTFTFQYQDGQLVWKREGSSEIVLSTSTLQIIAMPTSLKPQKRIYETYQYRDIAEVTYNNLQSVTDNTQLRPELISQQMAQDLNNSYYWSYAYAVDPQHLQLYKTQHNYMIEQAAPDITSALTPAQILALPLLHASQYNGASITANPLLYNIYSLAHTALYDREHYYTYLQQHNQCWQTLYQNYPGIFRESTYANTTAVNSQDLYLAAKAQLDNLARPSFEYMLTGMDIYMHDSDYIPTRLKLGEQIRIDYQEKDQLTDTLNAALREPLYITGISHALRNDGDYQFIVTTRTATDSMVQRFAQLLSFGR